MQNYWFDSFQKYLVSYLPSSLSLGAFSHHCYFLPDFPDWSPWCFLWLREVRSLHCCFQAQRFPSLNLTHRSQLDFINTQLISSKCLQWTTMNISYLQLNSSQFFCFGSDLAALMQILNGPRCPGSHCQSLRLLRYSPRLTRHVVQHLTLPARINMWVADLPDDANTKAEIQLYMLCMEQQVPWRLRSCLPQSVENEQERETGEELCKSRWSVIHT